MQNQEQTLQRVQEQIGGQVVDQVIGTFERKQEYSDVLSAAVGKPVYIDHIYCKTRVPGNQHADHVELVEKHFPEVKDDDGKTLREETKVLVTDYPIRRFPLAWDAFLKGEDLRPDGTPLEDCEAVPKSRVAALKAASIKTVEELASIPDRALQRIGMDARALQKAAQDYLDEHDEQSRMKVELEQATAKIAKMEVDLANAERGTDGDSEDNPSKRGAGRRRNSPE